MMFEKNFTRRALTVALVLASPLGLAASVAEAQVRAVLAPVTSTAVQGFGAGHRFDYCPGFYGPSTPPAPPPFAIPLEWDVLIQNDTDTDQTLVFDINAQGGSNGNYFNLNCPVIELPPGVNPVADVTCVESSHTLQVRNITVGACDQVRIRFSVDPIRASTTTPYRIDACMGGTVTAGPIATATETPLTDQVPNQGGDTCVYFDDFCTPGQIRDLKMFYWMDDENGPPLMPGDFVRFKSVIDLRYMDLIPPPPEMYLRVWDANTDAVDTAIALPQFIDFVEFTSKPLEASGAVYQYNAGTRMLSVFDPDCPSVACDVALATSTANLTEIVEWRGRVNCAAPNLTGQCHFPRAYIQSSWGSESPFGSDNWRTYAEENDATCATPTLPDLSTSAKRAEDGDLSGDAQPGELITFFIDVNNSTVCPAENMSCECRATQVIVRDTVDIALLDAASINPLDGGTFTPPNQVSWNIPFVAASGKAGSTRTVRFQARVSTSARNNDQICNTATVNAAEFLSTTDGGISSCTSRPPISVSVSPCLDVNIPPGPSLSLAKSITAPVPAPSCYVVGSTLTFSVTVTNVGQGQASNVVVRDVLDAQLCPAPGGCQVSNISDAGTLAGRTITWPALGTLAGGGGTKTYTFDLVIPRSIADGTTVTNVAATTSTEIPTAVPSNTVSIPVCAPVLGFTKDADNTVYSEGDTVTWTLNVSNTGGAAASNVVVTDTIDVSKIDEATLTWNPNTGTWNATTKTYTWPALAALATGQTVSYTITGRVRTGTGGSQVCNTGKASWNEGLAELSSSPTTGTCSDIRTGGGGCQVPSLGTIGPVKGVRSGGNAVFSWPALSTPPTEYHLNSVTAKADVPPAASCPATTGSKRSGCGGGTARDTQTTANGTHTGAIADPARLLFYQVYAACGGTGDLEGPF